MSAVETRVFEGDMIRCVMVGDEPWFVALDVARVLEYRMASDMVRIMDADTKGTQTMRTAGGEQRLAVISEAGLYDVILRREAGYIKNPAARSKVRAFKRWVTHEVLPQIRQTGSYSIAASSAPVPELTQQEQLLALAHQVINQASQLAVAAPKVEAFDELMDATGLFTMEQVAKSLGYGRNVLFRELRKLGILQGNNLPYQSHMRHFDIKVGVRQSHDGLMIPTSTTLVRPSGVEYLRKRLARAHADVAAGLPALPGTQTLLSP